MDSSDAKIEGPLAELQKYARLVQNKEYVEKSTTSTAAYNKSLDRTLAALKAELEQESRKSRQLQSKVAVPLWEQETNDTDTRIVQLKVLSAGYRTLSESSPSLPSTDSRLPALIAGRELAKLVSGFRTSVQTTLDATLVARRELHDELNNVSELETLHTIFERRIDELKVSASRAERDDSHTIAVRLMDKEKLQTRHYQQDRLFLKDALDEFIIKRLSPLLAAEELGGPVAGSVLNITDDMLAAGFTDRGKVNKGRKTDDDHRQRRIDEMFGNLAVQSDDNDLASEAAIAAQAMRDLLERLVQLSFDSGGARFIELEKEDAASRFLVRSKVAVLDPRDGRRIRLVDFGKPLDDWL